MLKFLDGNGKNIFLVLIVVYFAVTRGPGIIELYKLEGEVAPTVQVQDLRSQASISLPPQEKKVLVFWATWCGPCKVELARINKLIKSGDIKAESVLAISVKEDAKTVADFIKGQDFLFNVALDPSGHAAELYQVAGTPTIYLIDEDGKTEWVTMGLSASLEIRIKSFLN